jgi:cysteine desulfurase
VIDYPDILTNAAFFEESGFEITYLSADWDGFVNLEELRASIKKETILVMTTFANHVLGTIQPIREMKEILMTTKSSAALFVDAGHAYGRISIDIKELDVDMLSFSAHKIHGPQGAGALYVKKGIKLAQTKHGVVRVDEFDTGGISMAALAGMAKAIELQFNDLQIHIDHMRNMQKRLLTGIEEGIGKVLVNGIIGEKRICHNLNISIEDVEGEGITLMMDIFGITVATGSACSSQGLQPNYIMMATGRSFVQSHGSIKFTLSRLTTEKEIDYTIEKFNLAVTKLKKITPLSNHKLQITNDK